MADDFIVASVKEAIHLSRQGKHDESFVRYQTLFDAAEFAAASPDTEVQAQLARAFAAGGRAGVEEVVRTWPKAKQGTPARGKARATVGVVAEEREALTQASSAARLSVRGERIARLG